jgi:hypothetical protein
MLGRAVRGFLSKISTATVVALFVAPAACSVGFTASTANGNGSGDNNDVSAYDAGMTDDRMQGGNADGGGGFDGGATTPYVGSPLCNYSKPHSCLPDVPPSPSDCNLPDAGANGDAGAAAPLACRLGYDTSLAAPAPTCARAGIGKDGDACQTGADCAAGFECIGSGECRHYCCEDTTCDASPTQSPTFCDVQAMKAPSVAGANVPACMPVRACKLLMPGYCNTGETCAVVKPSDGTTSCVAIGTAKVGESCDTTHCADGLVCLGAVRSRTCFQLCHTAATECPSGKMCKSGAPLFPDSSVGICE